MDKLYKYIGITVCIALALYIGISVMNGLIWLGTNLLWAILNYPSPSALAMTALLLFYISYLHLSQK
jgi:hypothetical protein